MRALKAHKFFSFVESCMIVMMVVLIANIEPFDEDVIFYLADRRNTYSTRQAESH